MESTEADLERLAESFSSDVINEAISEIVAEEDEKVTDNTKWYRQKCELTPTAELSDEQVQAKSESSSSGRTSCSTITQQELSVSLEKVSPIVTPRPRSAYGVSSEGSTSADEAPPTSYVLKGSQEDIPGYVSPNTRQKLLDEGFGVQHNGGINGGDRRDNPLVDRYDSDEEVPVTLLCDDIHDTLHDTIHDESFSTRKNSQSSYSSGSDDRSSKSNGSKLRSDGTSSVGSTTVFQSIASGAFSHKRHMSPLLDMSGRSAELKRSPAEGHSKGGLSAHSSTKSSPRDATSRTSGSFKLHDSSRDLHSQLSSATEYETLPIGRKESAESPGVEAHLMLSPDLAQRVSDILNHSIDSPSTRLKFTEVKSGSSVESSVTSSPRELVGRKGGASTDTSLTLSHDELDRHVSDVLQRSSQILETADAPDHSYLDKYMSPQNTSSEQFNLRPSPTHRVGGQPSPSERLCSLLSPRLSSAQSTPREYGPQSTVRPDSAVSSLSDGGGQLNKKYMDKSSREVLEQAADEYYRSLRKTDPRSDNPRSASENRVDSSRLNHVSGLSEELAHLADSSFSPSGLSDSKHIGSKPVPASLSEADTQSLVAKRLDRIEFMVLSALNEVPPQSRPSYVTTAEYADENVPADYVQESPVSRPSFDSRDVIKKAAARSPLASLPNYTLDGQTPSLRKQREESFNVSISPVRKEPFTAFNRAQDLLAERLTQRSNERTPGRRLSRRSYAADSCSPTSSPTRSSSSYDRRRDSTARSRDIVGRAGLENIPEPLPLQIVEAGKSPPDDLVQRRKSKGRSHSVSSVDSVTTVESSHPESDDVQPPKLPKEAYGSRKDPIKSTPGIYGTRTPKAKLSDSEATPKTHSAINRAEEVLLRGEEIRGQIQARCDERSKRRLVAETQNKARLSSSPERSPNNSIHPRSTKERLDSSGDRPGDRSGYRDDVPLDFYTPPRAGRVAAKEHGRRDRADAAADGLGMDSKEPINACEERTHDQRSGRQNKSEGPVKTSLVERSSQTKFSESMSPVSRSPVSRSPTSRSPASRSPASRSPLSRSPISRSPVSRSPVPRSVASPSPSRTRSSPIQRSPRLETSRRVQRVLRDSQRSPKTGGRVRPLERVDQPDLEKFRSKLSHAVSDRLTTYHILREELMKAEDDAKGRDLNLAWQRIIKRKPKAPSELDESCVTSATSTASSEMFDESKMNKLKSLLHNPLGHLVSKSKASKSGPNTSGSGCKYEKLMSKIQQQREEESLSIQSMSNTTTASSDETFCSRCDEKRSMKRAKKLQNGRQQTDKHDREISSSNDSCSTRPVTPTGLPVPFIQSQGTHPSPPLQPEEKRLKDVGVMFPSPSTQPAAKEIRVKKPAQKKEKSSEKEAVAWFVDDKRDNHKGRNTFEKSRSLDKGQGGLVWFVPANNPRPWKQSPKERKAFSVSKESWNANGGVVQTATQKRDVNDICEAFNEATGRTGYVPTLQEAFRERNRKFISASRERQRRIHLRADERQITKVHDEQRATLFDIQPHNHRPVTHKRATSSDCMKRAIPKEEMYDRTNRKYRVLPEVKDREKRNVIQQERNAFRLKAKLFNKKVQRHVLDQARITNLVGHRKSHHKRG